MLLGTAVVCCNSSCRAVTMPLVTSAVVDVLTHPTTSWPCISTASVFVPPTSIPMRCCTYVFLLTERRAIRHGVQEELSEGGEFQGVRRAAKPLTPCPLPTGEGAILCPQRFL